MKINCPKCQSDKVITTDNEPLFHPRSKEDIEKFYGIDDEVYADAVCTSCNHEFKVIGKITEIIVRP